MTARSQRELISDCVHCGFCLPACPTYVSWGEEMDSPRGRIDDEGAVADGDLPLDAEVRSHFDARLGCTACGNVCPSGVRYDLLIEATRATVESGPPRMPADRAFRSMIFALFPYPARLRVLLAPLVWYAKSGLRALVRRLGLLQRLPRRLAQLDELLPDLDANDLRSEVAPFTPAANGPARARVGLLAGCVARVLFPRVNEATVRVLAAEGCDVVVPAGQGCCGALSLHSGRLDEAKRFARALIARMEAEPLDAIVVNAAGCGSAMKTYGELLADDPVWSARAAAFAARVRDVTEYVATARTASSARNSICASPITMRVTWPTRKGFAVNRGALLAGIPGARRCARFRTVTSMWKRWDL